MRALIFSVIILGAVIGATRSYALNPQPLPPRIAPHLQVAHGVR